MSIFPQHLVAYPILQGRVINLVAYLSDVEKEGTPYHGPAFEDVTKEEVIPFFDKWEEEVRVLIQVSSYVPRKSHDCLPNETTSSRIWKALRVGRSTPSDP